LLTVKQLMSRSGKHYANGPEQRRLRGSVCIRKYWGKITARAKAERLPPQMLRGVNVACHAV